MINQAPFFSICVPTRNRPETLFYCLKTLLHQQFDSYEIIVSDNCDEEESEKTKKMVDGFGSEKIKYFKPTSVLSMTANYEFALSKATGQFIICMGDDDGLVADSLQYVHDFIQTFHAKVVKCVEIVYWWPGSHVFPESGLSYPMERPISKIFSKSVLEKVANFELGYFNLPMLYYSFVDKKIIDEVIQERGSFFQDSASIDMYSGFVIAYKTESFFLTDKPFIISGQSKKSTGASTNSSFGDKISKEHMIMHDILNASKKFHVPFFDSANLASIVLLELKKFKNNFSIKDDGLKLDVKNIFIDMLPQGPYLNNLQSIGDVVKYEEYPDYEQDIQFIKSNFLTIQGYYPKLGNHNSYMYQSASVQPAIFGITDVYGASLLCKDFIEIKKNKTPLKISTFPFKKTSFIQRVLFRLKKTYNVFTTGNL